VSRSVSLFETAVGICDGEAEAANDDAGAAATAGAWTLGLPFTRAPTSAYLIHPYSVRFQVFLDPLLS
jgi:hypothetical protein